MVVAPPHGAQDQRVVEIFVSSTTPLPHIQDFGSNLHGSKIFSVLDLQRGYHQVPMDPADIKKTAIITPFGLFEYLRMPFGMKNSAQAFQRLMDQVFRDLPFTFVYLRG